jgi:HlyD family secretion protein
MNLQAYNLAILSLSLIMLMGCGNGDTAGFLGSGTLEGEEVIVSSLIAGRLDSLTVSEGDEVQAGQFLALIDIDKLLAQQQQTEAALAELEVNRRIAQRSIDQAADQHANLVRSLNRQKHLLETGSSTQQIVDDLSTQEALAKSRLEAARDQLLVVEAKRQQLEAALELIKLQVADGEITAPLSGTVIEKYIEAGENAAPGSPLVKIVNLDEMRIKIYLSERDVGMVKIGSLVRILVDALPEEQIDGRVAWISPRAEFTPRNIQTKESRADLVFAVTVEFDNPEHNALIGMPADVVLP